VRLLSQSSVVGAPGGCRPTSGKDGRAENLAQDGGEGGEVAGVPPVLPVDAAAGAAVAFYGEMPERLRAVLDGFHGQPRGSVVRSDDPARGCKEVVGIALIRRAKWSFRGCCFGRGGETGHRPT